MSQKKNIFPQTFSELEFRTIETNTKLLKCYNKRKKSICTIFILDSIKKFFDEENIHYNKKISYNKQFLSNNNKLYTGIYYKEIQEFKHIFDKIIEKSLEDINYKQIQKIKNFTEINLNIIEYSLKLQRKLLINVLKKNKILYKLISNHFLVTRIQP